MLVQIINLFYVYYLLSLLKPVEIYLFRSFLILTSSLIPINKLTKIIIKIIKSDLYVILFFLFLN